jgi:hypothetical protein
MKFRNLNQWIVKIGAILIVLVMVLAAFVTIFR